MYVCKCISAFIFTDNCNGLSSYIQDGYCDDQNNNGGCHYDQGDCCGNNVDTTYCTECICFEDLTCSAPLDLIGNGVCNDETNNAECNFDGGDCCEACINTEHCTECLCHEGGEPTLDISCKCKVILF